MAWTHSHQCACGSAVEVCTDKLPNFQSTIEYNCPKYNEINRYQFTVFAEESSTGACSEDSTKGRAVS